MSDLEKMEMRHKCLENIEDFNKDLSDECYTKRGKNVTLPECGMTSFNISSLSVFCP